jgi:hypothetical protein
MKELLKLMNNLEQTIVEDEADSTRAPEVKKNEIGRKPCSEKENKSLLPGALTARGAPSGTRQRCSLCNEIGHRKSNCPNKATS